MARKFLFFNSTPPGPVYATWNTTLPNTYWTFSNGNLTAAVPNATANMAATVGKSSGKWYWEIAWVGGSGYNFAIGVMNNVSTSTIGTGKTNYGTEGWAYIYFVGFTYIGHNSSLSAFGPNAPSPAPFGFGTAEIYSFALDISSGTGTLHVYRNGTLLVTDPPATGITGTIYPAIGNYGGGAATYTANFGQNAWAASTSSIRTSLAAAGYTIGLY